MRVKKYTVWMNIAKYAMIAGDAHGHIGRSDVTKVRATRRPFTMSAAKCAEKIYGKIFSREVKSRMIFFRVETDAAHKIGRCNVRSTPSTTRWFV